MKDLIIITSYCDTFEKEEVLRNLVSQINSKKSFFDVLLISHTTIPQDIQKKVNYFIYDEKNELLSEWEYLLMPYFIPENGRKIISSFVYSYNTHLTIWRMLILANSFAKNMGYKIVHHIEFDSSLEDFSEFENNSLILEKFDVVVYMNNIGVSRPYLFGSFQSYRLDKLPLSLLEYNSDEIKNLIKKSNNKMPELMFYDLLNHNSKVFEKKREVLNNNRFGLSHIEWNSKNVNWCIPYYDEKDNGLWFLIWNEGMTKISKLELIYNETTLITLDEIMPNNWKIIKIDNYDNSKKLTILLDNKVKNVFEFDNYKEKFKKYSFIEN
jgi:hypothetical protein